ncbi:phosphate ABC transporter permease subunit PstC [Nocardioides sp. Soil805]|uniref:phosphate ABC transporter permease subunit PstC n=1 Tax=Nocardioides sp. Soil805 TaxID=1736416 RepID=UPI000702C50D|nr:phosphate ABC transporter permease subunit PstC [Nocardioides sp. Soil805]KRF35012.1 phosphate ABC transporter permease [Nocardioides sp. Soil805]
MSTTSASSTRNTAPTQTGDRVFSGIARTAGLAIVVALAGVFVFLAIEGIPGFFQPEQFYKGAGSFWGYVDNLIFGTVLVATIALIVAVPLAFGIALVVSHYAPKWIAGPVAYVIDLLAAVPSVVFGLWGINLFAPKMVPLYDWLHEHLGFLPFFKGPVNPVGTTLLTTGLVLAIMVLPIITAISREVFTQTPVLHEEAALALGATRWEMIRLAVFPYARSGMVSAVMLGLGRALGETMAVAMVLSGGGGISFNLITNSNPTSIAANIASQYKENTPGTLHVLIATGLVLFLITFLVNFAARWIVARNERRMSR